MKEKKVNFLLIKTRKLADKYFEMGREDIGKAILGAGSREALRLMEFYGIKSHPVICPTCSKQLRDKHNIIHFNNVGECLACDHIRGDR